MPQALLPLVLAQGDLRGPCACRRAGRYDQKSDSAKWDDLEQPEFKTFSRFVKKPHLLEIDRADYIDIVDEKRLI